MILSGTVFELDRVVKIRNFSYPTCIWCPLWDD